MADDTETPSSDDLDALLDQCRIDVWRPAVPYPRDHELTLRLTHLPTGTVATATGVGELPTRSAALAQLAETLQGSTETRRTRDDPGGPIVAYAAGPLTPETVAAFRGAWADAQAAAVAAVLPVWLRRVDDNVAASPEGHLEVFFAAGLPVAAAILQAAALRAYAERWHGTTEGVAQQVDYGTGVEYDAVCQCGVSVDEDGCPEAQQLAADAAAIEAGQPFRDIAEEDPAP